jgi:Cof subfamily protein (haloacid dehalogenase superfamily)
MSRRDWPFPYRLAAVDLDGTLLGPDKRVSADNLRAVRRLQERGARIVIASGRRYQNSLQIYRELGLDGPIIACQGALVIDPATSAVLESHPLPPALAAELVTSGQRHGSTIFYYHRDHIYTGPRNHWTDLYASRLGEEPEYHPDLESLRGADALKIVWYGEPTAMSAMRPGLEAMYDGRLSLLSTERENLEFMLPGIDKATGLRAIVAHYGLPLEATLAFGDGENDAPMLRLAGLGVAMDCGNDFAHSAADLIGPEGDPETSFARAVEAVFQRFAD